MSTSFRNRDQYPSKLMHTIVLLSIMSGHANNIETNSSFISSSNAQFSSKLLLASESGGIENNTRKVRILSELPRIVEPNMGGLRARGGYVTKSPFVLANETQMTLWQILVKAGKRGLGGGIPGAIAGFVQVICLMWLRTIVNYQYRYGTTFQIAFMTLYNEGGIRRFYRGLSFAIIQSPLSRFVSTAANDGVDAFLVDLKFGEAWGPSWSVLIASFIVGVWRMALMPIDTCKTVLQVDSVKGFESLMRKVKAGKVYVLYEGALAQALYAIVSHYPWFYTYNYLSKNSTIQSAIQNKLLRNAAIGFISSALSDSFTNVIRVIKTTKQAYASKHPVSYSEVVAMVFAADGWKGLFGRGLRTRILGNAVQSVLFTVVWRGLAERWRSDAN